MTTTPPKSTLDSYDTILHPLDTVTVPRDFYETVMRGYKPGTLPSASASSVTPRLWRSPVSSWPSLRSPVSLWAGVVLIRAEMRTSNHPLLRLHQSSENSC